MRSLRIRIILFLSLLLTALAMAAGLAHLFELPNKLRLSAENYRTASFSAHRFPTWRSHNQPAKEPDLFRLSLAALLCMVAAQAAFWTFTFPVNVQTQNWTVVPGNWVQLRDRWEYSHAAGAVFDVGAFIALVLVALAYSTEARGADRNLPRA